MKVSVVTISFNQGEYLQACIDSVANQTPDWEHIIVDPGSTDGSRAIIQKNRNHFSNVILGSDRGPADGLNKGFACAKGDIFYYLNADDVVLPGAFSEALVRFAAAREVGVLSGHGFIIDEQGRTQRKCWSEPLSRHALAHGGVILIQPSTFIRRFDFERAGGFNVNNRSNWDDELTVDMFLNGSRFAVANAFWSGYRVHSGSITGTGKLDTQIKDWSRRRYEKITGRSISASCRVFMQYYHFKRLLRRPERIAYRLVGIKVYRGRRST